MLKVTITTEEGEVLEFVNVCCKIERREQELIAEAIYSAIYANFETCDE